MDAPHDTQKRACSGASVLQERQTRLNACAQAMQKRASEGFSSPHDGQRMVARFVASPLRQTDACNSTSQRGAVPSRSLLHSTRMPFGLPKVPKAGLVVRESRTASGQTAA